MPTTKPAASVTSLLSDKIDHLEFSLSKRMDDLGAHLGDRLTELTAKVNTQNGRVGKVETEITKLEMEVEADLDKGLYKRQMAALFDGGGVVGAVTLEVIKHWLTP